MTQTSNHHPLDLQQIDVSLGQVPSFDIHSDIEKLSITRWLNFASGSDTSVFVALPLIQRGSVWRPNQIIDLWDTLLRGMPMGSLMFSPMPSGIDVRKIGQKEMIQTSEGFIGLIDGQQRTLTMLLAWPNAEAMDRRIWVDFADTRGDGHLFRLHVTTKNQPFGFQRASPSAKLSLDDKRKALETFEKEHNLERPNQEQLYSDAKPYHSKLPIDLKKLLDIWIRHKGVESEWIKDVHAILSQFNQETLTDDERARIEPNISEFTKALNRLFNLKIPLLKVDPSVFSDITTTDNDESSDPSLAILFKRIGTGGTALSDADYVYAVIKHHLPQSYRLVEELHAKGNIAGLLSATDVVMTAVRLAAAEFLTTTGKPLTDWESPSKRDFHSLIKQNKTVDSFLKNGFLPLVKDSSLLIAAFDRLTALLQYDPDNNPNGLPLHAFPLLKRPLIQILLRWIRCVQLSKPIDPDSVLKKSRDDILRFVMFWQLCVIDPAKASLQAFKILTQEDAPFPAKQIVDECIKSRVAIPLIAPNKLNKTLVYTAGAKKIRGWKRFYIDQHTQEKDRLEIELYRLWWGNINQHVRPMLLWLQRETVAGFQGSPVADREEDTPYDYDHICPSNHWNYWTGSAGNIDSLMQFIDTHEDGRGHVHVGNSIGNLRVWESSLNRHDGDANPIEKLELNDEIKCVKLLNDSAIHVSQIDGWKACSEGKRSWNSDRALAFQQVVEQRAFTLYERYYNELDFSAWSEEPLETEQSGL